MTKIVGKDAAPTMIIPSGTRIEVDPHGQLSICAPGNLVIQNSGSYGTIESQSGSIRIERNVEVEAVAVRCSDACYVQGSLTAWKVTAKSLQLEDSGQAHVVLQETDRLVVGNDARLVGNFGSEKELFFLFSRFADQVRSLPFFGDRRPAPGEPADALPRERLAAPQILPIELSATEPEARAEAKDFPGEEVEERADLPEPVFFALVLLERDAARKSYGPTSQRVLEELIKLLHERDLETLRHTHRTLFGRIVEPGVDVQRAAELIASHFAGGTEESAPPS